MEVGLHRDMHTYSGGLGVLSGDTIRGAADLALPMVAVTLAHRTGYFRQRLDVEGYQRTSREPWTPEHLLEAGGPEVRVPLAGRSVTLRSWVRRVRAAGGGVVPVYFLDADVAANNPEDRRLTDELYGGDERYRLEQEVLLGMGGVALLRALGFRRLTTYHMNEGHSSLAALALLERALAEMGARQASSEADGGSSPDPDAFRLAVSRVRERCVFTTHTPVSSGHDRFPRELAVKVLGEARVRLLERAGACREGVLNMTEVGIHLSRFTNGVSLRHAQVSQDLFPERTIHPITNGVHAATWTGPALRSLLDLHLPGWDRDPFLLRHAVAIPTDALREAHGEQKRALLEEVEWRTGRRLDRSTLTIGFARRATAYKRADLLFRDVEALRGMAREAGPLQVIMAGRSHPRDADGQATIRRVHEAARLLGDEVPVVYLENYDMELGALLTAGVDLWLNNPTKPLEASGTSGMKAALNGVPSLSVLDGWWVEGHVEGVTGWAFGGRWWEPSEDESEARALRAKLREVVIPLFYGDPDAWGRVMGGAIALNGSHFHVRRMMLEYANRAYGLPAGALPLENGGEGGD